MLPASLKYLQDLAPHIAQASQQRLVPHDVAAALKRAFPEAVYVSLTEVVQLTGSVLELQEQYNMLQGGLQNRLSFFSSTSSVAAEVVSHNCNKFYEEVQHPDMAGQASDFRMLRSLYDCGSLVCVPLPCHSKLVPGSLQDTTANPQACPRCHRSLGDSGLPLGCMTVGVSRGFHYPVREYVAKLVVLAGYVGPLLAPLRSSLPMSSLTPVPLPSSQPAASAAQSGGHGALTPPQAQALAQARAHMQAQGLSFPPQHSELLQMALQNNWYNRPSAPQHPDVSAPLSMPLSQSVPLDNSGPSPLQSRDPASGLHPAAISSLLSAQQVQQASLQYQRAVQERHSAMPSVSGGMEAQQGTAQSSLLPGHPGFNPMLMQGLGGYPPMAPVAGMLPGGVALPQPAAGSQSVGAAMDVAAMQQMLGSGQSNMQLMMMLRLMMSQQGRGGQMGNGTDVMGGGQGGLGGFVGQQGPP